MTQETCERHDEVVDIARSGGWPDRCDDDLLAHVATCSTCGDIVTVISAITEDMQSNAARAAIPPAGAVWWRMQRRKRLEAERSARRIVTALQGLFVAAGAIVVALLVPSFAASTFSGFFGAAANLLRDSWTLPLIVAGATLAVATPVALVFALRD